MKNKEGKGGCSHIGYAFPQKIDYNNSIITKLGRW
jgi:hypothetical protein